MLETPSLKAINEDSVIWFLNGIFLYFLFIFPYLTNTVVQSFFSRPAHEIVYKFETLAGMGLAKNK